jgi:3-oxoacyl-[acyl-carrier-protein] synthase II
MAEWQCEEMDMVQGRRVVVVGMGTVNPLGNRVDEFWKNIKDGKSGIGPLTKFDVTDYPAKIAGEIKNFDPSDLLDRKEVRSMADFTQYAAYAAAQAMQQAKLGAAGEGGYDPEQSGVYLGNGIGGFEVVEENLEKLFERGPRAVAPLTIPKLIANEAAGNIAMKYGIKGPCHTTVTACASGTDAIGEAFRAVKFGVVDIAVTGGTEGAITRLRDGFVLGEGAGILVLEELEHAKARGAQILGEIVGYGMTCDAFHLTAPDPGGDGAARAMSAAMREAGIRPDEVDYINAHGTSTEANDVMETRAIKRAFGDHAYKVKVSSTKSMTSHLVAAAGAVEAIVSLLAIRDSYFPCTLNMTDPDPECDLDYVPNKGQSGTIRYALSESLGFGGHNGALVFKGYDE